MSTVAPTGGQTALGTSPVAAPNGVVIEANAATQTTIAGNIITGTVIGRDARGAVEVRTQNGVILLQTNARLPVGASVTLQVQTVGPQLQAVLLQVTAASGRPLTVGIDPGLPQAPTHATPPIAPPPQAAVTVGEGPTVTAIVVGAARTGLPDAGAPPDAPAAMPAPAVPATQPALPPRPVAPIAGTPPAPAPPGPPAAAAPATALGAAAPPDASATIPPPAAAPARAPTPATPSQAIPQSAALAPAPPAGAPSAIARTTAIPPQAPQPPTARASAAAATLGLPLGSTPLIAAVIESGSAAPAASLAYAVTQAATTHVLPPRAAALAANALAESLPGTVPARSGGAPAALPPLPPGSTLEVRIAVTAEVASAVPTPGRTQLPAILVGRTPTGQGIVDTPAGRLAIPLPPAFAAAPMGTRFTLDVIAWRAAIALRAPATHDAIESAAVRPVADTLDAIARVARDRGDAHDILPRPGPRLARQLVEIAAALATGDAVELVGKRAVETLERHGQGELVRRLERDLSEVARALPQTQDWRSLILPFMVGEAPRPLRIYVRQRHERARDKQQGTRFVVECEHDELGALQLDGLVHARRIDVILRTHSALPDPMRGDLSALFGDACGVMGYSGQLDFQAVATFPPVPRAEPTLHHIGVMA